MIIEARLLCGSQRGQQVSHQRGILGNDCTHMMKHTSEGIHSGLGTKGRTIIGPTKRTYILKKIKSKKFSKIRSTWSTFTTQLFAKNLLMYNSHSVHNSDDYSLSEKQWSTNTEKLQRCYQWRHLTVRASTWINAITLLYKTASEATSWWDFYGGVRFSSILHRETIDIYSWSQKQWSANRHLP